MKEDFLNKKLNERKDQNAFRYLRLPEGKIDFCSNDYLGIAKNNLLLTPSSDTKYKHGSGGSRLLAGNYPLIEDTEKQITAFHHSGAALIFNSGYDANVGLLSAVLQRGDTVIYDYLSHASIRDGIRLSFAQAFSFLHNDVEDLEKKLQRATGNIFVVTESVFSMDGDEAPLREIVELCKKYNANLIVDEAHATGVVGEKGEGLVQHLQLEQKVFSRVHTFGKALGCHGAVILGSETLRNYLINFARSFIYTTSLPEISIAAIKRSYEVFPLLNKERSHLQQLINQFQHSHLRFKVFKSNTPIQIVEVPGNDEVKAVADLLQQNNLDVRPILYPTVPKGGERLRIVLHAFNTTEEVSRLCALLS
ncbi:MAG: aminotransferase class I/II-fold pyridoxal phosphate-dependent enzyme [Sphingobacteriales bacterium]